MDTTGTGEAQSELMNRVTSRGFIRKQGLVVYSNDGSAAAVAGEAVAETSLKPATGEQASLSQAASVAETIARPEASMANKVKEARMQGYEGESCPECQNFTLVRNGTCLKCNTCGSTTGCS
jgi:ribonucleoside-diphosphate reductase alpha chain